MIHVIAVGYPFQADDDVKDGWVSELSCYTS